jgi:SAM-dependent methyltransferase
VGLRPTTHRQKSDLLTPPMLTMNRENDQALQFAGNPGPRVQKGKTRTSSLGDFYERLGRSHDAPQARVRAVKGLLKGRGPASGPIPIIVDLGCGSGLAISPREGEVSKARVFGLDIAKSALELASQRGILPIQASLEAPSLPFRSGVADVVILSEVIEHLIDTDHVLEEVRRILRPDGELVLTTPNLAAWFNRLLLLFGVQPLFSEVSLRRIFGRPGGQPVGHLRLFTERSLVQLLNIHGFRQVAITGVTFHAMPLPLQPLDRLFALVPSLAGILAVRARVDPGEGLDRR